MTDRAEAMREACAKACESRVCFHEHSIAAEKERESSLGITRGLIIDRLEQAIAEAHSCAHEIRALALPPAPPRDEREAFEAWAVTIPEVNLTRGDADGSRIPDGRYKFVDWQHRWEAWQARAALRADAGDCAGGEEE